METSAIVPVEVIEKKIFLIRGQKVMLGSHLAELYDVETRALVQAVKRNASRFPSDFVFQLSQEEAEWLVSQNVIPHRKYFGGSIPYAFTEQGVAMLSSVLRSERAVLMNIAIMRTFVQLRRLLSNHEEFLTKLKELENRIERNDDHIRTLFDAIRQLMTSPEKPKYEIGFRVKEPNPAIYKVRK